MIVIGQNGRCGGVCVKVGRSASGSADLGSVPFYRRLEK